MLTKFIMVICTAILDVLTETVIRDHFGLAQVFQLLSAAELTVLIDLLKRIEQGIVNMAVFRGGKDRFIELLINILVVQAGPFLTFPAKSLKVFPFVFAQPYIAACRFYDKSVFLIGQIFLFSSARLFDQPLQLLAPVAGVCNRIEQFLYPLLITFLGVSI